MRILFFSFFKSLPGQSRFRKINSKAMERRSNLILADVRGFQESETDYKIRGNPLNPRHPRSIAFLLIGLDMQIRIAAPEFLCKLCPEFFLWFTFFKPGQGIGVKPGIDAVVDRFA